MARALALAVAVVHLTTIAFVVTGGLLSWRWPRLLPAHGIVAGSVLALNLARWDCPLTDLELWLRERAGAPGYSDGFISHYLVEPWYPAGITPGVQVGMYLVAAAPNLVAYAAIWHGRRSTNAARTVPWNAAEVRQRRRTIAVRGLMEWHRRGTERTRRTAPVMRR